MFDAETLALADAVLGQSRARAWRVATAESCTGGLVAAALTAIAGASDVVERGVVTYSNKSKIELLGVPAEAIAAHGAISAETAAAMATGALARTGVELAVSVTGIAGPSGGTPQKPVGLVYLAVACKDAAVRVERRIFPGDRGAVRHAALVLALQMLRDATQGPVFPTAGSSGGTPG